MTDPPPSQMARCGAVYSTILACSLASFTPHSLTCSTHQNAEQRRNLVPYVPPLAVHEHCYGRLCASITTMSHTHCSHLVLYGRAACWASASGALTASHVSGPSSQWNNGDSMSKLVDVHVKR